MTHATTDQYDDGILELFDTLPAWIQREANPLQSRIEEIKMHPGYPLILKLDGEDHILDHIQTHLGEPRVITKDDLDYMVQRLGGFRDDNRAGINRTLHRISKVPGRFNETMGATIRVARHVYGAADALSDYIAAAHNILLIGPPGVGKTTLLREVVRLRAQRFKASVVVIDTSGEVCGEGLYPHPAIFPAVRIQVGNKSMQPELIRQALANHGPKVCVVDEIGYHDDAEVLQMTADRGVDITCTAHGRTLRNVVDNPKIWPLLGYIELDKTTRQRYRITDPTFDLAIEVRGKGKFYVHDRVTDSIDALLRNEAPEGHMAGRWADGELP